MNSNTTEYQNNMEKLISTLRTIMESDEYVIIQEKYNTKNSIEYGMYGHEMTPVSFSDLNGQTLGEFLYQGICAVAPGAIVNITHVSSFGDIHDDVIIDLNDKVHAVIIDDNHKNTAFIKNLSVMMKEETSDVDKSDNPAILSKKIKPICYFSK